MSRAGSECCKLVVDLLGAGRQMMTELLQTFPGIDEAMSYSEVMKYVQLFISLFRKCYELASSH